MAPSTLTRHIVKRKGRFQRFDERKVYASVYAAALNCHESEQKAEQLAQMIAKKVKNRIQKTKIVSSEDIRKMVVGYLKDKDVALMYTHHRDLC